MKKYDMVVENRERGVITSVRLANFESILDLIEWVEENDCDHEEVKFAIREL